MREVRGDVLGALLDRDRVLHGSIPEHVSDDVPTAGLQIIGSKFQSLNSNSRELELSNFF